MLFLGIPLASRSVLYIVRKIFLRRSQRRWNRKKRCGIDGDIQEISLTIMNHGGGMRSGVLESPSGNLSVGVRIRPMLLGTLTKGRPSILLEFSTEIHTKPGHDKAYPCFAHISRSTLWKPAKIGIFGKLRSWRIQRRRLQGFWIRTRVVHLDLLANNQGGSDKQYWCFPFLQA